MWRNTNSLIIIIIIITVTFVIKLLWPDAAVDTGAVLLCF
jgi:hypothetical protein